MHHSSPPPNRRNVRRAPWLIRAAAVALQVTVSFAPMADALEGCAPIWKQCAGLNETPRPCCDPTHVCRYVNDYWWQCDPPQPGQQPPPPQQPVAPAATPTPAPTPAPTTAAPTTAPTESPTKPQTQAPTAAVEPAAQTMAPIPTIPSAQAAAPPPVPPNVPVDAKGCPKLRVRRNFLSLQDQEIADYVEAFNLLKSTGAYDKVVLLHGESATWNKFHFTNFFCPWHRWYTLYMEDTIRALGGKWTCFTMPYWDWTLDAGNEWNSPIWKWFGPVGDAKDSYCVKQGAFANWTNEKGGCIKRVGSTTVRFFTPAELVDLVVNQTKYDKAFRPVFETGAHARPHMWLGGTQNTFPSPNDPWFWLHHAMVDKVWAMWQDCHGYNNKDVITVDQFLPTELSVPLTYTNLTTRDVWNITAAGYTYETDMVDTVSFAGLCTFPTFVAPQAPEPTAPSKSLRGSAKEPTQEEQLSEQHAWGAELVMQEKRMFDECIKKGGDAGTCRREVLRHECTELGPICSPPPEQLTAKRAADLEVFKKSHMCAKVCENAQGARGEMDPGHEHRKD